MSRLWLWTTVLALTFAPELAWAQRDPEFYGPHMMWGSWYGMFFGPLMMIVFIAAVVVLVILAVRWFGGLGHGSVAHPYVPGKTPLDILKERFARGEIDKDEFEERRRLLAD
jgi:putative membrane protein